MHKQNRKKQIHNENQETFKVSKYINKTLKIERKWVRWTMAKQHICTFC